MKIKILSLITLLAVANTIKAQTLFTYGDHAVSKNEFLQAYNKNPDTTGDRKQKLKEYLNLYINFRLKLQAAYSENANADATLKTEADNFKAQLADNFINKQADINGLMHEAFLRSRKDILLQQVFVQLPSGDDTTAAYAQILKAYNDLKAGADFEKVSGQYSNVPGVKEAKGNIGYITVFTLPYSIENMVYSLKPGTFTAIYRSKSGYHIFKNAGERPAAGRRKIKQLLFNVPGFYTQQESDSVKHVADSVYTLLQKGSSFDSFLPAYGHSNSENENVYAIEVKPGDYAYDFEKEVYNLKAPQEVSQPFKTAYGYNIVQLDEILPVSNDENDVMYATYLQTQIQKDGRLEVAKNKLIDEWFALTGFKEASYNKADLWAYSDSALMNSGEMLSAYKSIKPETVLFSFAKKKITVKDWIDYLQNTANSGAIQPGFQQEMNNYTRFACDAYYREHIEDFDSSASDQLKEFNEANLLFYVMDKHVWSKASNDTAGLRKYYEAHKSDYTWQQSITAIVVSAPQKILADSIALKIKNDPANWRGIVAVYEDVYADSSRFNMDELPVKQKLLPEKDYQTAPESNDDGTSYTFVHVLQVYDQPQQKTFEEAKGLVINDYQQALEQEWINELKKIYPVKVDANVFNSLD